MRLLRILPILLVLPSFRASGAEEDILLSTKIDSVEVEVDLFVPKESRPIRGLLIHAANHKIKTTGRWPTLCRELGFAHLVTNINIKLNNRPKHNAPTKGPDANGS